MKTGVRALGVAESYRGGQSTLAGAVVRASRIVDDFGFESCSVGGTDATDAVITLFEELDREDVRYVLVSGIALAWYNVVNLQTVHDAIERPVFSVTYEESDGLEDGIREAFDGEARDQRLDIYRTQPERHALAVNGEHVFVRAVGIGEEEARDVVRAFTPEGGRPEPLRVARLAARAADSWIQEE